MFKCASSCAPREEIEKKCTVRITAEGPEPQTVRRVRYSLRRDVNVVFDFRHAGSGPSRPFSLLLFCPRAHAAAKRYCAAVDFHSDTARIQLSASSQRLL